MDTTTRDRWLKVPEVMVEFGISRSGAYKLHEVYGLGKKRPGIGLRFRLSELQRYMEHGQFDRTDCPGMSHPGTASACEDSREVPGTEMTRRQLRDEATKAGF
jgi:predicted DNA-binding transcriptional regulator AlpA